MSAAQRILEQLCPHNDLRHRVQVESLLLCRQAFLLDHISSNHKTAQAFLSPPRPSRTSTFPCFPRCSQQELFDASSCPVKAKKRAWALGNARRLGLSSMPTLTSLLFDFVRLRFQRLPQRVQLVSGIFVLFETATTNHTLITVFLSNLPAPPHKLSNQIDSVRPHPTSLSFFAVLP